MNRVPLEKPLAIVIIEFFNMCTGSHPRSDDLWEEELLAD